MARALQYIKEADKIDEFSTVMARVYAPIPGTHREFKTEERWYTESGSASVTDGFTGETYTLEANSVLICPSGSGIQRLTIEKEWRVKQLVLEKPAEVIDRRINIQINWLIIQTILEILREYDNFVSAPNETEILFKRARMGDLYINDDCTNYVDQCIDDFVSSTGISRSVWTGERRLRLNLKYTGANAEFIDEDEQIDVINANNLWGEKSDRLDFKQYGGIKENPLGLQNESKLDEMRNSGLFTLKSLLTVLVGTVVEKIMTEVESTSGIEFEYITVPDYKKWKPFLGDDKLPQGITYGNGIRTVIEKLFLKNI